MNLTQLFSFNADPTKERNDKWERNGNVLNAFTEEAERYVRPGTGSNAIVHMSRTQFNQLCSRHFDFTLKKRLTAFVIYFVLQIGSTELSSTFDSNRRSSNHLSRPKKSLGSAHVKHGVWPGPLVKCMQYHFWSLIKVSSLSLKDLLLNTNRKPELIILLFSELKLANSCWQTQHVCVCERHRCSRQTRWQTFSN